MNRIKDILKERGVTQVELADMLGVSRSSIVKTLAGNPSQETLEKIATVLGVEMWELFASSEEVARQTGNETCPYCGQPISIKTTIEKV